MILKGYKNPSITSTNMMETDPYGMAPTYRTAEPMVQTMDSKSSDMPLSWKSAPAERRKKVDSVASLNEMAERDMAEFMSERSYANNLFGYSPQPNGRENLFNDEEQFSGQGNVILNRNYIDPRERSAPPTNQVYGNAPLFLSQNTPVSAILHQSHSSYGPPSGPIAHSPTYFPVTPILPQPSPAGLPAMPIPASIPVHQIPQNHFVAIQNPGLRPVTVQSPPAILVQTLQPPGNKSPLHDESPRLRDRVQQPQQPVRERAQDVTRERAQPPVSSTKGPSAAGGDGRTMEAANHSKPTVNPEPARSSASAAPPSSTLPKPVEKNNDDENDITISFRPKISLARGEVVRLVLSEFQGLDVSSFRVTSDPPDAFASATWVGKEQALGLTVNKEMPAHEKITVIIPSQVCIRKISSALPGPDGPGGRGRERAAGPLLPSPTVFSKNAINLELRLRMEMHEVARDIEGFKTEVVLDVARAAGISPASLQVSSLQAGSIIVHLSMAADCADSEGRGATEVARRLTEQARDRASRLFQGKHTRNTISLELAQRERPPPPSAAPSRPLPAPPAEAEAEAGSPQVTTRTSQQSLGSDNGSPPQDEKRMSAEEEKRARAEERRKRFLQGNAARPAARERASAVPDEAPPPGAAASGPLGIDISFAINLRPAGVFVTDVRADGAAYRSGQLFKGDVITRIDGRALTSAVSKADAAAMLLGPPGTEVVLDVLRPNSKSGNSDLVQVTVRRLLVAASGAGGRGDLSARSQPSGYEEVAIDDSDIMFDEVPVYDDIPTEAVDESTEIPEAADRGGESSVGAQAPAGDPESMTQAEWARKMLQQKGTEERKTVQGMNLDAVRQQAQWAKEQLNSVPEQTGTQKFDPSSVAQQAQWAKEQLSRPEEHDKVTKFDSSSVAQQAQWAKEQLSNLPEHEKETKFDASSVAQQAQWAKEQLSNLPEHEKETKFDPSSVAQQAQWAKEQLSNMPEKETEAKFDASAVAEQAKWAKEQIHQKGT